MTDAGRPRIGVFGGTFDPPHIGHVAVAADVADRLALDRVLWIPARQPPHKPSTRTSRPDLRLEMVREAVRADPRFEASALELDRPGPSYTVDTLLRLRSEVPEADLYLIVGEDQFRELGDWHRPDELVKLARLAVMDRAGASARDAAAGVPGGDDALFVPVRRVDVSSTAVREAIRAGRDVTEWLPPGVAAIIEREGLYSAA